MGLDACNLVMKGGITSGIVYPKLVLELSKSYRFNCLGGTSAGAIAAAITAAAELNRKGGGFEALSEIPDQLGQQLADLFQPYPQHKTWFRRILKYAQARPGKLGLAPKLGIGLVGFVLSPLVFIAGIWVLRSLQKFIKNIPNTYFGLCPGTSQPGFDVPALTPWLDFQLEKVAGRLNGTDLPEKPLTFGDLKSAGITLRTVATDLSRQTPISVPLRRTYAMKKSDLQALLPPRIVQWIVEKGKEYDGYLIGLPAEDDFPVLLAVRMSLSFPFLLSALPFYAQDHSLRRVPDKHKWSLCWISDGGITSNFPIHLFEDAFPDIPTFGIALESFHEDRQDPDSGEPSWNRVFLPQKAGEGIQTPIYAVGGVFQFLGAILDSARNWQDTSQSILPGYRERIVHIALKDHEGGMNLNMSADLINRLSELGSMGGQVIANQFEIKEHQWRQLLSSYAAIEASFEHLWRQAGQLNQSMERWEALVQAREKWPLAYDLGDERTRLLLRRIKSLLDLAEEWQDDPIRDVQPGLPRPRAELKLRPSLFE